MCTMCTAHGCTFGRLVIEHLNRRWEKTLGRRTSERRWASVCFVLTRQFNFCSTISTTITTIITSTTTTIYQAVGLFRPSTSASTEEMTTLPWPRSKAPEDDFHWNPNQSKWVQDQDQSWCTFKYFLVYYVFSISLSHLPLWHCAAQLIFENFWQLCAPSPQHLQRKMDEKEDKQEDKKSLNKSVSHPSLQDSWQGVQSLSGSVKLYT